MNTSKSGFSKVSSHKRGNKKQETQDFAKKINSSNSFEILGKQTEKLVDSKSHEGDCSKSEIGQSSSLPSCPKLTQEFHMGNLKHTSRLESEAMDVSLQPTILEDSEEMNIGVLDIEGIEKACSDKALGYVPQEQVSLLEEAILKDKFYSSLGINSSSFKETK